MRQGRISRRYAMMIRFFIPYMIILLVPIVIGTAVYNKSVKVMEQEVIQNNMTVLEQTKEILDGRLSDIEINVRQIIRSNKVNSFQHLHTPFEGVNTYRIVDTRSDLYEYALVNSFVVDYFILFKNSELAISANTTYRFSEMYEDILKYEDWDYNKWYDEFLGSYRKEFTSAIPAVYKGKPYSLLTYVQTMGNASYFNGSVIVLIDNKEIQKLLTGVNITSGGSAYIADEHGKVISLVTSDETVKDPIAIPVESLSGMLEPTEATDHMMVTYTTSQYNGWKYVAVQPADIVLEKVNYIKNYSLIILLAMFALGLMISFYLAYRSSRPVRRLLQMITERTEGKEHTGKDTFGYIQDSFSELYNHNESLYVKIKRQLPLVRAAFFERLLRGEYKTLADVKVSMEHLGITMRGTYYTVILIYLKGYKGVINPDILKELNIKRIMVTDVLETIFSETGFLHDTGEDKIALVISLPFPDLKDCEKYLKAKIMEIRQDELKKSGVLAVCGVGRVYSSLLEITSSYEEARHALNYRNQHENDFAIWYNNLPIENGSFYYPGDVESRLMNFTKAGDHTNLLQLLQELYKQNMNRHLSQNMMKLWFYSLWGTVVKLIDYSGGMEIEGEEGYDYVQVMIGRIDVAEYLPEMYEWITKTLQRICLENHERKKSHNEKLKEDILFFIQTEYDNPDMCLDKTADRFQISTKYLSQFFKEQTGVNFFEYLNYLRMEEARQLLHTTDLSVNEITYKIGFNSTNVFSRAFKRANGMSPTAYRRTFPDQTMTAE